MMSKIGDGELKVEGNSLVESTETTTTSTQQDHQLVSPVDQWVSEFEDFVPPAFGGLDFSEFERDFSHLFPAPSYGM